MKRARPLWMLIAALLATMSLAVAAGCGDDSEEAADGGESVATQVETRVTTAGTGTAGTADAGTGTGGDAVGATTVEIPADEQALAFQKEQATAPAGEVTLRMPNPSSIPHNISVDEPEKVHGETVTQGGVSEITVDFPSGEYEYYCSVPGHREAGMVGTLSVE